MSLHKNGTSGKLRLKVFSQFSSISEAKTDRIPAIENPLVKPPQPENRSIDVNASSA